MARNNSINYFIQSTYQEQPMSPHKTFLKSLEPEYTLWYETFYENVSNHGRDGDAGWLLYKQKSWPCSDGVFETPVLIIKAYHRTQMIMALRENADLNDPYVRATYDAIKGGSGASTTALSAELLPTCSDYVPSKG